VGLEFPGELNSLETSRESFIVFNAEKKEATESIRKGRNVVECPWADALLEIQ